ncbi:helix-turn-helix transcriptional regulator [Olleya sp. HaHaR_3_96]|uniref:helix-turn-helix domain-containing protein n=1 Tax=Olleya sp. HaHaR_3_96 TaxID=2745560 RepID=UPI001C4E502F|nr:helix-turn-helix transcriptional regulator [Olleya sp. HaHaR_3_96]QXP61669.1 helix-turn-helix transcriptional regulator [Olleya sp. HaHaR_3_96]
MPEFNEVGLRFYKYLKNKGLGVNDTARKLGFSGSQISNIKNGRVFGTDKVYKILNEFKDLDANWLFRGVSNEIPEVDINQLDYTIELQKERIIDLKKENAELKKTIKALHQSKES